jgi:hypothetical protein
MRGEIKIGPGAIGLSFFEPLPSSLLFCIFFHLHSVKFVHIKVRLEDQSAVEPEFLFIPV